MGRTVNISYFLERTVIENRTLELSFKEDVTDEEAQEFIKEQYKKHVIENGNWKGDFMKFLETSYIQCDGILNGYSYCNDEEQDAYEERYIGNEEHNFKIIT